MTDYTLEPVEGDPFAKGYKLEPVSGDPFTKKKTETGFGQALAYGAENVMRGADATTNELKSALGMAKSRSMATALADKIHQAAGLDNYAPAGEGLMDNSKGVGERLTYAPRALVEGLPSILTQAAPGKIGMAMGLANNVYQNLGKNIETAEANNQGMGGALAATGIDAALSRFGIESALGQGGSKAGTEPLKRLALGIGAAGAQNAGQTAVDKNLIEGAPVTGADLAVSGLTGMGAAGLVKGARGEFTNAGEAYRFRKFADADPKLLAKAAQALKDQVPDVGRLREENAGAALDKARLDLQGTKAIDALAGLTQGKDIVKEAVDAAAINGPGAQNVPYAYRAVTDDLNARQPVRPEQMKALEDNLTGSDPYVDSWLEKSKVESILNQLGQMGARQGDAIRGGMHAGRVAQGLKPLGRSPSSQLVDVMALGGAALGHSGVHLPLIGSVSPATAGAILAGHVGGWWGLRGIDRMTGMSDPVGRFARRFGEDPGAPQSPIAAVMNQPPQSGPQSPGNGPQTPPSAPQAPMQPPPAPPAPAGAGAMARINQALAAKGMSQADLAMLDRFGGEVTPDMVPANDPMREKILRQMEVSNGAVSEKDKLLQAMQLEAKLKGLGYDLSGVQTPLGKPKPAPEVTGSVEPMPEEAPKQDAPPQERPMFTTNVFGRDVSIPLDQITHSPKAWAKGVNRDATIRRQPIETMKNLLPKDLHDDIENLFTAWLSPGTKMQDAYFALEELVNDKRVPDKLKGQLLDLWSQNQKLTDPSHWE